MPFLSNLFQSELLFPFLCVALAHKVNPAKHSHLPSSWVLFIAFPPSIYWFQNPKDHLICAFQFFLFFWTLNPDLSAYPSNLRHSFDSHFLVDSSTSQIVEKGIVNSLILWTLLDFISSFWVHLDTFAPA